MAFLPVKGNSERIENKNCKLLDGKPLFLHTLEKLASCDFIDEVYLDSEADEILQMAPYLDTFLSNAILCLPIIKLMVMPCFTIRSDRLRPIFIFRFSVRARS